MIILDLCGGTGSWSMPWKNAGYTVQNITLPSQDVKEFTTDDKIYGVLFAPVCTCFSLAGNRWKRTDREIDDALELVEAGLYIIEKCNPVFWVVENPYPGKLTRYLGKPNYNFHPWFFGDMYHKRTGLWGNFNFPVSTNVCEPYRKTGKPDWHHNQVGGKSARTKEIRSITPAGFANAFFEANKKEDSFDCDCEICGREQKRIVDRR